MTYKETNFFVAVVSLSFTFVTNWDHMLTANTKRIGDGTVSITAFSFS